ncbi:MAG: hypothetical protein B6I29_03275 [Marinitoga sp. 4572_148]|nr:MAG: hypothetical protein B6I29_03275 [Marinitoga sp. 4572_148]
MVEKKCLLMSFFLIVGILTISGFANYFKNIEFIYSENLNHFFERVELANPDISYVDVVADIDQKRIYAYSNVNNYFYELKIDKLNHLLGISRNIENIDEEFYIDVLVALKNNIIGISRYGKLYIISKEGVLKDTKENKFFKHISFVAPYDDNSFLIVKQKAYIMNLDGKILGVLDGFGENYRITNIKNIKNNLYILTDKNEIFVYNISKKRISKKLLDFRFEIIDFTIDEEGDVYLMYKKENNVEIAYINFNKEKAKVIFKRTLKKNILILLTLNKYICYNSLSE